MSAVVVEPNTDAIASRSRTAWRLPVEQELRAVEAQPATSRTISRDWGGLGIPAATSVVRHLDRFNRAQATNHTSTGILELPLQWNGAARLERSRDPWAERREESVEDVTDAVADAHPSSSVAGLIGAAA